ncbi:hypothetical protein TorRG33x02_048830 [Trema orientale]|uniref:Uncharacterized protein n=1 Tax=Trema orientale TaxID=63057 RepID=A0A2P5FNL8_TREOI|nr:hypothetical protein TorRG33x02_048830 [Trema orientale]
MLVKGGNLQKEGKRGRVTKMVVPSSKPHMVRI